MIIPNKFNGYSPDGRRLYFKKGGSSGTKEMQQMEADRQRKIQDAVNVINNIFDPQPYHKGVNVATSFDPNQTYYNADGSRYAVPSGVGATTGAPDNIMQWFQNGLLQLTNQHQPDYSAAHNALANGQLFTGLETINPEGREKLYADQKQAIYDINAKEVHDQYSKAERANRFGLARNGLMGGSADIDSNARLQEKTNEGIVQAQSLGEAAASQLRTADENSKASLISMAQSGIDTGTAQQMAASQLASNQQAALGARGGASIGDLFGSISNAYLTNRLYQAAQNGYNAYQNQYGNLSTRNGDQGTIGR